MDENTPQIAFQKLLDQHGAAAWSLLKRLCSREQDAEDVFQETSVRVWKAMVKRTPVVRTRGWLMTVAYHTFIDHTRKRQFPSQLDTQTAEAAETPAVQAERREEQQHVHSALNALSPETRDVFILHYTAGLSLSETAETMGIREGTAKSRLHRGLVELRRLMK